MPVLALLFAIAPAFVTLASQREPHVREAPGAPAAAEWVTLAVSPDVPPEAVEFDLLLQGHPTTLRLRRHSLRASGARLRVVGAGGRAVDREPPPAHTYRGDLRGEPGSAVLASWTAAGLEALVVRASGERFRIEPARLQGLDPRVHSVRPEPVPAAFECGSDDRDVMADPGLEPRVAQDLPARCLVSAEIAFEADFEYYQAKGASTSAVVDAVDAMMNQVEFFYARDVQITYALTAYVVRTAPFYTPTSGGTLLEQFRDEWNTNQASIPRDIAHLMTGKPGSLIEFGGLAYVGVVCTGSQYGWSMDGANIVGHEVGHNWGAGHCHDLSPCNNMCGACFYVGPNTRRIIAAFRDSRTCLERVTSYTTPLPPYAHRDAFATRKDEVDTLGEVTLDVLANDQDGNCTPIALADLDGTSERGAAVRAVVAAPHDTRGVVGYTLPATPFVGRDRFAYVVTDGVHDTAGEVQVDLAPLEVAAWWPLDEGAGTVAGDVTGRGFDGSLSGAPTWIAGQFGGALSFDGIDDAIVAPPLGLASNQMTMTAWIRSAGPQAPFAGLIFCRGGTTVAGLHFVGNRLGYTWNDDPATYGWTGGPTVPANRWVFVALVVEGDRAWLHLRDGPSWVTIPHVLGHSPLAFDGETWIGRDPAGSRWFQGRMDDPRVFAYPLSHHELDVLASTGGPADGPAPRDGAQLADAGGVLSWVPNPAASARDVYLGTDWAGVRDATPAAPEFLGTVTSAQLTPGGLLENQTYFWRVDEHLPAPQPGHVWQFELADFHRWPLDETSGTTAFDAHGTLDGTYQSGVLLNQAGAIPTSGTAAFFDGINDRVVIPALDLDSNRVTITTWMRRSGSQSSFAGIVFSRTTNTVAGLDFGNANELRYHWNGDSSTWGWDSGLVPPDGQWVFVALVVEPGRARLHLGSSGSLTTAINPVTHAAEEFDGNLTLGRDPTSSARSFRGWLDDVRVYDHALTEAEVLALYLGS